MKEEVQAAVFRLQDASTPAAELPSRLHWVIGVLDRQSLLGINEFETIFARTRRDYLSSYLWREWPCRCGE